VIEAGRVVASPNDDVWFCDECYRDFRDRFRWVVVGPTTEPPAAEVDRG
jgi:hypothetical protein